MAFHATFSGTDGDDRILRDYLSPGVTTDLPGATGTAPGSYDDSVYGYAGDDVIETSPQTYFVDAGSGDDRIDARANYAYPGYPILLVGGPGDDLIIGSDGRDYLDFNKTFNLFDGYSEAGNDTLIGGKGDDIYIVDSADDLVIEEKDGGHDEVDTNLASYALKQHFEDLIIIREDGPTTGIGNAADNFILAVSSGGVLSGRGGNDSLYAGILDPDGGSFRLNGGTGDDDLVIYDVLGDGVVRPGADTLRGGNGNDRLTGDADGDCLIGGRGNDVFVYNFISDSTADHRDVIRAGDGATAFQGAGSAAGDLIDLSAMDIDPATVDVQSWAFGGTGAGQISLVDCGRDTLVRGNADGDADFEFQILIGDAGVRAADYTAADFILTL